MAGSEINRTCILSHGRSGTLYTSLALQAVGLDFGHEKDGKDGAVGGIFFQGKRDLSTYDLIFHQVRNPLDVISSSTTCRESSFRKTFKEIGAEDINETDVLRRAMLSWALYTAWAEQHSIWRYKIEDFENIWPELLFRMGVERVKLPNIPKNINSRLHRSYTWNDLYATDADLAEGIQESARKFGYE